MPGEEFNNLHSSHNVIHVYPVKEDEMDGAYSMSGRD